MAEDPVERLRGVYDDWHGSRGGSPQGWLDMCHEDIRQTSPALYGPGDERRGKAAIGKYLGDLAAEWEEILISPTDYMSVGDQVIVVSQLACRHRRTGKPLASRKVDIFRFEEGLIVEAAEYVDAAAVAAARA